VLAASGSPDAFDSKLVDDPIVFRHESGFYMLYIGFDGQGYQAGLAMSSDLVHWKRLGCVAKRDPNSKYTRYNVALSSILRESGLTSQGRARKVHGRYLGAWNAYPNPGYEEGAAVIGLAWSDDLLHWELTEPILFSADGAPWEHGGLYRPNLIEEDGVFYLYYNAKTDPLPKAEGGGWHEQTGVATSHDLKHWVRYSGNPVLRNGGLDAWDARFASNPFVVRYAGRWGMYYYGLDVKGKRASCWPWATIPITSTRSTKSSSTRERRELWMRPTRTSHLSSGMTVSSITFIALSPASGRTK